MITRKKFGTKSRSLSALLLLAVAMVPLLAISISSQTGGKIAVASAQEFSATLDLSPAIAVIGDEVSFVGAGYEPNADVELVYHTVSGRYEVTDRTEFIGQRYEEASEVLATVKADEQGSISGSLEVPQGYGGTHDVRGRVGSTEVSQAGLMVQPRLTMTPSEGPIGTLVELKIEGVDLRTKVNTWQILYDNHYLGFASAVTTNGVAIAQFRAAGPVGTHIIQAWNNAYNSTPYLAWDTSPFRSDFEVPVTFTFEVTEDPGYLEPMIDDFSERDDPWPVEGEFQGSLTLSKDRGNVGDPTTLSGSGLPTNTEIELRWWTMVGNRVSGVGFTEEWLPLDKVMTDENGEFVYEMTIPDDLGGSHRVDAWVDDEAVAAASMVIIPSLIEITPIELRAGETVEIHLKGVGWTTYDNTYTVVYDNSHIGYVCGFSTNGDVLFSMTVTGEPGTHLIDLYPTIYKGEEPTPKTFSVPQLTYAQDHPERALPAIRLSIVIVD